MGCYKRVVFLSVWYCIDVIPPWKVISIYCMIYFCCILFTWFFIHRVLCWWIFCWVEKWKYQNKKFKKKSVFFELHNDHSPTHGANWLTVTSPTLLTGQDPTFPVNVVWKKKIFLYYNYEMSIFSISSLIYIFFSFKKYTYSINFTTYIATMVVKGCFIQQLYHNLISRRT